MIILDTHVWWWVLSEPERLSPTALDLIKETPPGERGIASISIWEFAMMASLNKISLSIPPETWMDYAVSKTGLRVLEINGMIAVDSCTLPGDFHKDPADRIIVATARRHNAVLVTKDQKLLAYSHVNTVW